MRTWTGNIDHRQRKSVLHFLTYKVLPSSDLRRRFVLANTESLHDKITELATRVRQLEDALQEAHSLNSTSRHPLLAEDLLQIKNPLQRERMNSRPAPSTGEQDVVDELAAVGSL